MADESGSPEKKQGFWPEWMTPRRWWEFASNIMVLERTIRQHASDNRQLRSEVRELQVQVERQGAQIELLREFVRTSLSK